VSRWRRKGGRRGGERVRRGCRGSHLSRSLPFPPLPRSTALAVEGEPLDRLVLIARGKVAAFVNGVGGKEGQRRREGKQGVGGVCLCLHNE